MGPKPARGEVSENELCFRRSSLGFLPGALGCFGNQTLFECGGGNANVPDFTVHDRFDALQIREKTPLGDGGDVRANAARFLGLTRAPDDAALHRAFAGQFTNA